MRRKDREVTDRNAVFEIINRCSVVHLAMIDGEKPYAVALNFGFDREGDDLILYFHSASAGKKIDILRKNPQVFFQMACGNELVAGTEENPCGYCWKFDSVTGSGTVAFIEDEAEKAHALNRLIGHLSKTDKVLNFPPQQLAKTCVFRLRTTDITGKHHE